MISISSNSSTGQILADLATEFPKQFPKALNDLGKRLRNRMATELRAGVPAGQPEAPLDPLTVALKGADFVTAQNTRRRKLGKKSHPHPPTPMRLKRLSRAFGGKLPDLIEYQLGNGQLVRVGWLGVYFGGTDKWGEEYQQPLNRPFTRVERMMIRLKLGSDYKQPAAYSKPEREAIAPYQHDPQLDADIQQTVIKSIQAQIDNSIRKFNNAAKAGN